MGLQLRTVTFKGQERKKYQRDPDKRETKNQVKEILGGSKGEKCEHVAEDEHSKLRAGPLRLPLHQYHGNC